MRSEGEEISGRDEMRGRELLRRGDAADERLEIEGKWTCSFLSFWFFCSHAAAVSEYLWSGGGRGVAVVLIKAPVCFCYYLSPPSLPLSASTFPILKPRGKAKPAVNLNRYNSCRPKQCTEGNGSERQKAVKVGTDRNNAPGMGVWGGGCCELQICRSTLKAADSHVPSSNMHRRGGVSSCRH